MRISALLVIVLALALVAGAPLAAQDQEPPATEPAVEVETPETDADGDADSDADDENDSDADDAEKKKKEKEDDRVRFEVEVGDGRAVIRAEDFNYQPGEHMIATSRVEVRYRDLVLKADRARLDIPTRVITAEGNVVLDEGPQRLTGDTLEYHLETRTGRLTDATAHVQPDYYFSGAVLAKTGPQNYAIDDGTFTSCKADVPPWSIALSSADVTIEKYARIRNARMRIKNVPVLYVPYLLWPAKTERTSGFLTPKPGYSSLRGAYLGLGYFQTIGRSADATFNVDGYSEGFLGTGALFRWRPSEVSAGALEAYFVNEPADFDDPRRAAGAPIIDPNFMQGDDRWKVHLYHETQQIFEHFRGVINYIDYSDFEFQGDYEQSLLRTSQPYFYSNAYLSGNFGNHSLNFLVDRRERAPRRAGGRDIRHQLPEIEYRLRPTQLGRTPVYFSLLSSANAFRLQLDDTELVYQRADVLPFLSIPLSTISWLSAKLDVGGRVTFYTDSLDTDRRQLSGDSLTRTFGSARLELVGPSFSRIFDKRLGRFTKLKHVIEPRLDFNYVSDFDDQLRVLSFDEVDLLLARQDVVFSLNHRLIAKPGAEDGEEDESALGAFEIASFSIAQGYSFDNPLQLSRTDPLNVNSNESPIVTSLRLNPSLRTNLRLDAVYNTLFDDIESTSLSGQLALGPQTQIGAAWFARFDVESPSGQEVGERNQAQVFGTFALLPNRFYIDGAYRVDLELDQTLEQIYRLRWDGSCYGLSLEWQESNFRNVNQSNYRFLFTLKHVGTFLDITGSTSSSGSGTF